MMQFRPKRSQEFYAPGRDILGFFRPLNLEVINMLYVSHDSTEVDKLEMLMNGVINEATAGIRGMKLPDIVAKFNETLEDIDPELVSEYTRLMTAAFVFRYVLGKREVPEDQVKTEDLGKVFSSIFMLGVVPEELSEKVAQHMRAHGFIPRIVYENEPPCVVEEVDDTDG